ncbi:MAG: hypothetical protein JXR76_00575 [Deltaproteobacteria bacterium]|nr:hypothetical protein [Deltaproteobacteria bacterium]
MRDKFPTASFYWMAGYEATKKSNHTLTAPLQCDEPDTPNEYTFIHRDSFGAVLLYALLAAGKAQTEEEANMFWQLALKWRRDAVTIYQHKSDPLISVFWQLQLAMPRDTQTIEAQLRVKYPGAYVILHGKTIAVFMTMDPTALPGWISTWQCLPQRPA